MTDEGKILLLDLGRSDGKTNRLIGSLVVTGLELAMRRRRNRYLCNLTIRGFHTKHPRPAVPQPWLGDLSAPPGHSDLTALLLPPGDGVDVQNALHHREHR